MRSLATIRQPLASIFKRNSERVKGFFRQARTSSGRPPFSTLPFIHCHSFVSVFSVFTRGETSIITIMLAGRKREDGRGWAKVWPKVLVQETEESVGVEHETSISNRSPALFIMFHILALFLANAARRSTLINEFIGNSRDVGLGRTAARRAERRRATSTRDYSLRHSPPF